MASPAPLFRTIAFNAQEARRSSFLFAQRFMMVAICFTVFACGGDSHNANTSALTSPTDTTPVPPARSNILYGLHSDASWYTDSAYRAQALTLARSLHARVVRIELPWEWVEYVLGERDWTIIDDIVNQLTAAGIHPLFMVAGTPALSRLLCNVIRIRSRCGRSA